MRRTISSKIEQYFGSLVERQASQAIFKNMQPDDAGLLAINYALSEAFWIKAALVYCDKVLNPAFVEL